MQVAKLRLKFRNDIRARQLEEYKDAIRKQLLRERDFQVQLEESEKMEYEAVEFQEECGMNEQQAWRMNEVLCDFQCNYSQMAGECKAERNRERMKDEAEESSQSTSGSSYIEHLVNLPKEYFDYSLSDLECLVSFCSQAEAQGEMPEIGSRQCLQIIPNIFIIVMEKYLPELVEHPNPTWSKLYYRLKRMWVICHKIMLPNILGKLQADIISREESLFATNLLENKVAFLYNYRLLSNRAILQENEPYFNYLFNNCLEYDSLFFPNKIKAAYFLLQQYGFETYWTDNHQVFFKFISISVQECNAMIRDKQEHEGSLCVILLLKMLEWVFSSERSKHLKEIYVRPEEGFLSEILIVGLKLKSLIPSKSACHHTLLRSMARFIYLCQLRKLDFYHQFIGPICEEAILSKALEPKQEILALEALSALQIDKVATFTKLIIHYTFSLRESEHYAPFLEYAENVLEGL